MICENCGFEHNSKGVCPKCGARVVYVDEDYIKRRQAYLDAQAKEKENNDKSGIRRTPDGVVIPAGVHYTTEDEHNMKRGKDRSPSSYHQENDEKAEATAKDYLERGLLGLAEGLAWLRKKFAQLKTKMKRRRGAANPVINKLNFNDERNLKFDDGKETLDTSKLVLAHKVFKDRRIPILVATAGGLAVVIGLIVFAVVWTHTDHSQYLIFSKSEDGSYTLADFDHPDKTIWSGYAELTAFSRDGRTIAYIQDSVLYITGKNITGEYPVKTEASYSQLNISENGKYYVLTGCINEEIQTDDDVISGDEATEGQGSADAANADETYVIYAGSVDDEAELIYEGNDSAIIEAVTEDGYILYERLSTAAYGVISSQSLRVYDLTSTKDILLTDTYTDYFFDEENNCLYYTTDEKLYRTELASPMAVFLDDGVTGLAGDLCDAYDGVIYEKTAGYYLMDNAGDEGECILPTKISDLDIFRFEKENLSCTYVHTGSEGTLYVDISSDASDTETESYTVLQAIKLINADGLIYTTESGIYIMSATKDGFTQLGLDAANLSVSAAAYHKEHYLILGEDDKLYIFDMNGALTGTFENITLLSME